MPICPDGHDSAATDFCDLCGKRIGVTAPAAAAPVVTPPAPPAPPAEACPQCGAGRTGKFCEACGFDFLAGRDLGTTPASPVPAGPGPAAAVVPPPRSAAPESWVAVVNPDRAYFDSVIASGGVEASAVTFPATCPERVFRLSGRVMRIGRRSSSRGVNPEIDLSGPPADPCISHMHAVLIAEPAGGWAILDPGSANGTQINGGEIATGQKVPLRDGDQIGLGAWTVLTIRAS